MWHSPNDERRTNGAFQTKRGKGRTEVTEGTEGFLNRPAACDIDRAPHATAPPQRQTVNGDYFQTNKEGKGRTEVTEGTEEFLDVPAACDIDCAPQCHCNAKTPNSERRAPTPNAKRERLNVEQRANLGQGERLTERRTAGSSLNGRLPISLALTALARLNVQA